MNTRAILGVCFSICFTAFFLALFSYLFRDDGVVDFAGNNWSKFNLLVGAAYGVITGALAGLIIVGLRLDIVAGILFGLVYNLILGMVLMVLAGGGNWGAGLTKVYYLSIVIGTINGAVVSVINASQRSLN